MLSALTTVRRGYSAPPFRTTDTPEASVQGSFRTVRTFLSDHKTLLADSNRSVSRRSKPSSRSVLMGEHPHPWLLLHSQDTESRHRSNKPGGRCELAPQTIQLSLEYLFCHTWASLLGHRGSLGHAFAPGSRTDKEPVRQAFILVLYVRFLTGLSLPLDPSDLLSDGYRPS
jgi:hypothetical protein